MVVRRGVLFYARRSQLTVINAVFTKMAGVLLLFRHSAKRSNAQEERQGSSEVARACSSSSLPLSIRFSIQDEALDVPLSAPQGAHNHADFTYSLNWAYRREQGPYGTPS